MFTISDNIPTEYQLEQFTVNLLNELHEHAPPFVYAWVLIGAPKLSPFILKKIPAFEAPGSVNSLAFHVSLSGFNAFHSSHS